MKKIPVTVDSGYKESMPYKNAAFPVDVWTDVYDTFTDGTLNCHWHPAFELGVLLTGMLDFYISGTHMRMTEGDCVFINSNTMHTARQVKGSCGAVVKGVAFPASLFAGDANSEVYKKYFSPLISAPIQGLIIPQDSPFAREMAALILEICGLSDTEFGYELNCLSLISRLWKDTLSNILPNAPALSRQSANRKNEERAKKILSYIHTNYAENITVDSLAKYANISRSECFRCFKFFTNQNPVTYINEYRLAHAAKLLLESDLSVTEIGAACGFNNSSYFGKLFKQVYGVSPRQYGKQ